MQKTVLHVAFASALCALGSLAPQAPTFPRLDASGVPSAPSFFPRAVWLQQPKNAPRFAALGINLYVGLWKGPTTEQLDALEAVDMPVVCDQNEVGLAARERGLILAWMHGDEPDNAQALADDKGYGPPIEPQAIVAHYKELRAADPERPVLLNLGQGVAWDGWRGRGVRTGHPEDYAKYVAGCDIASFDIYPVSHGDAAVAGKLEFVARGVQRLVEWCGPKKPVWACIETTQTGPDGKRATPEQLRSEVWLALIHGARGIIYFVHEFKPKFVEAGLLEHEEMCTAVKEVDREIAELAPVLNSPTVDDVASVKPSAKDAPIALMCKRTDEALYVFAVATSANPSKATFTLRGARGGVAVEVLGEQRALETRSGHFDDAFDGYAVHLYRVAR